MKSIVINASKREKLGKSFAKSLRKENKVPCVLYRGKKEPLHFYAEDLNLNKIIYTPNAYISEIEISSSKEKINAVLQEVQFHPLTDKIIHVDFIEIFDDKPVEIDIPVTITGTAPGVLNSGGVLIVSKRKLRIKAIPKSLPDTINVDISKLELGEKLYITNLENKEYEFQHPDNVVVCRVATSRVSMKAEDTTEDATEATEETEAEKKEEN